MMRLYPLLSVFLPLAVQAAELPPPVDQAGHWTRVEAIQAGLPAQAWQGLDQALDGEDFPGITSVLVARDGRLLYERYRDPDSDDETPPEQRLRDTRSATKTITGLLVGSAIAQGHIQGAAEPIMPWFKSLGSPANPDPRKAAIRFEDLLTMSSLLECNDDNPYSSGNEEWMYVTEHWTRFVLDLPIKGFAPWMRKPQDSPYGRSFSYCTAGVYLLGAAVERATGQPLADFAAEQLERPLGIESVQWNLSPEGVGIGGGGTRYRSRDLLKLAELLRLGGRWGDRQILPQAWVEQTLSVHAQARDDADYGYLLWRFHYTVGEQRLSVWAMSGNGGNYVYIDQQHRSVAVITSTAYNQRYAHPNSQRLFAEQILPQLVAAGVKD
ncbi:MAG: beta-lactamase family protein [Xanthomonadales bacterium]|nr:beta-lactamase family protein [Xanthomonadales bacterium]